MKPLSKDLLEKTRKYVKEYDTINPNEVWLRAWEIANERSLNNKKSEIYKVVISKEYEIEAETQDDAITIAEGKFINDFNSVDYGIYDIFDICVKKMVNVPTVINHGKST